MCAIIGAVKLNKNGKIDAELLKKMLKLNLSKGGDGAGIWSNKTNLIKGLAIDLPSEYDKRKNDDVIISHIRMATSATISTENCHPFWNDKIVMVHNGHISNYAEFGVKHDSLACLDVLSQPQAHFERLGGWYALAWADLRDKTFHVINNGANLQLAIYKGALYFATSELDKVLQGAFDLPDGFELSKKVYGTKLELRLHSELFGEGIVPLPREHKNDWRNIGFGRGGNLWGDEDFNDVPSITENPSYWGFGK